MEVLQQGQLFSGRYRVIRRLAEGGMGAVYIAVQEATELTVALKVLWPHVLQRAEAAERFALEAKIAARIKSDHIVQVFDAGFDEQTQMPFLVMELLEGATLQSLVEQRGALPPQEVVTLMTQAARGLDRAHAYRDLDGLPAPVIHRDLKPDNLFVARRETGEPLVKILDYGIAKVMSQSTSLSREIKGTPIYMAYEQAVGRGLSPQTDVWPFGLIAYFALTGQCYWRSTHSQDSDLNTLLTEIVALPIEPPSLRMNEMRAGVELPPAFDDWFRRCVNRDPAQRFPTAGEAVQSLAQVFHISPLTSSSNEVAFDATMLPTSGQLGTNPDIGTGRSAATMDPASISQPLPTNKPRWPLFAALALLLGGGAVAVGLMQGGSEDVMAASEPSATAEPAAPPPPAIVRGTLRVSPIDAQVRINGKAETAAQGALLLTGSPGDTFTVEVSSEGQSKSFTVRLLSDGMLQPDRVELPAAAATPEPTATAPKVVPLPRSKPVTTKPAPVAAPAPAPAPAPKPAAQPAPAPRPAPAPKPKFDPLAGPRVH